MYEPSWTNVDDGRVSGEAVRLKLEKDNLDMGRARSFAATGSVRGTDPGAGEVGRLLGLRNAGALRVYISFV